VTDNWGGGGRGFWRRLAENAPVTALSVIFYFRGGWVLAAQIALMLIALAVVLAAADTLPKNRGRALLVVGVLAIVAVGRSRHLHV
jgi:hypothetical protein